MSRATTITLATRYANGVDAPKLTYELLGTAYSEDPIQARRVLSQYKARTLASQHIVDNTNQLEEIHPALGRHILENSFGGTTS